MFQIACHEETYGLEKLYELCHMCPRVLERLSIGRVIARPFVGGGKAISNAPATVTTLLRLPPAPTVLDYR